MKADKIEDRYKKKQKELDLTEIDYYIEIEIIDG